MKATIWIVDFGSQYTQLITRKCRELHYASTIMTVDQTVEELKQGKRPMALILSGGPLSVFEDRTEFSLFFADEALPVLGICYGMQIMAQVGGGKVEKGILGEYGQTSVNWVGTVDRPKSMPTSISVWMSHFDHVAKVPGTFNVLMQTSNGVVAAMKHRTNPWLGLQFHPEVSQTEHGSDLIHYFLSAMANLKPDWNTDDMLTSCERQITQSAGDGYVLCAFSGGVDSLVAAMLAHRVLGARLKCFFVDNGLLRPQDYGHIETLKENTPLSIEVIDAKQEFLNALKGVSEPEQKRKIIGRVFIEVFEQAVARYGQQRQIHFTHLLQGTLYPDIIESTGHHKFGGKSATIKSHHNVGGLPERMKLKLLEPLQFLFKDEVRLLGEKLGLPFRWTHRHPFPGPGLGVRILGEITEEKVNRSQAADQVLYEELSHFELYDSTWQAFCVYLPVKTVGVKGDTRAYEEVIALRLVKSQDGMTCTINHLPYDFLQKVASRICNEVTGITRVVYDITSKPPGTIEWE